MGEGAERDRWRQLPVAAAGACVLGVGFAQPEGLPAVLPAWVPGSATPAFALAVLGLLLRCHSGLERPHCRGSGRLATAFLLGAAFLIGAGRVRPPLPPAPPQQRPLALEAQVLRTGISHDLPWMLVRPILPAARGESLWVRSAITRPLPPPGTAVRLEGLLTHESGRFRLEKAVWHRTSVPVPRLPLREWLRQRWESRLPAEDAGLACALLLGESRAAPDTLRDRYRDLGLVHLLCVSGMHLWLWDTWLRILLRGRTGALRLPLLVAVAMLAGLQAPVLRAAAALGLREWCHRRGLQAAPLGLWSAALWAELLLMPSRAAGLGFVLSYSATFALLVTQPRTAGRRGHALLIASTAATLGAQPWLFRATGLLQPWSPLLSPAFALLLPIRILISALALLPGLAEVAAVLLRALRLPEDALLELLSRLPGVPLAVPHLSAVGVLLGSAAGLLALRAHMQRRRWRSWLLAASASWLALTPAGGTAGVLALPVGHGLAMVVGSPERSVMFDCGSAQLAPEQLVRNLLLPELRRRGWRWPRDLVLSHQDRDHRNGVPELLRIADFKLHRVPPGAAATMPPIDGARLDLLGLQPELRGSANAEAQAIDIAAGSRRFVLLGDPWGHALLDLCRRIPPGPVELVMLPHHGRTLEGVAELLEHLQPRECWIPCSESADPAVLQLLEQRTIRVRRTGPYALNLPLHAEPEIE